MKRRERKKTGGAPGWMVTYSDMVTLILVFFILLFSMSQIDQIKFESVTRSFQDRAILDFLIRLFHPKILVGHKAYQEKTESTWGLMNEEMEKTKERRRR